MDFLQVGVYQGAFFASEDHEFYDLDVPRDTFATAAMTFGLRLGFTPHKLVGVELEGGFVTESTDSSGPALLWTTRAHLIGQYDLGNGLTPFVVAGGGWMGVLSDDDTLGNDTDVAVHFGLGAKYSPAPRFDLRLDGRAIVGPKAQSEEGNTLHFEVLGGASYAIDMLGGDSREAQPTEKETEPAPAPLVYPRLNVGIYLGSFIPSKKHEFYDLSLTHDELATAAVDFGLRVSYLPLRYFGAEVEGGFIPSDTKNRDLAFIWALRAHAIGQYPMGKLTPFAVVGVGGMGVLSGQDVLGNDQDFLTHYGLGFKVALDEHLYARVDGRLLLGPEMGSENGITDHYEVLGGLAMDFGLGR